jgi:hypothetical protein
MSLFGAFGAMSVQTEVVGKRKNASPAVIITTRDVLLATVMLSIGGQEDARLN